MQLTSKTKYFAVISMAYLMALFLQTPAMADLATPTEAPILTVSGKIAKSNRDGVAEFDLPMLKTLELVEFTTKTPWFDNPVKFSGVRLRDVLAMVEANGTKIEAVALGDYKSIIPIEDINNYDVIMAFKRDDKYMSVRDKGPLFIVYPFDSTQELHHQQFYSRSVWQLEKLVVLEN